MESIKPISPMLLCDFYKIAHREQYPKGTEFVYSTWTARSSRIPGIDKVVAFGFQQFVQEFLIDYFWDNFFARDIREITEEYKRMISKTLGVENPSTAHITQLHSLKVLPLRVRAVPEGTLVPVGCPMMTIENTDKNFFWLTNYIETLASTELWQGITSATIAHEYRDILEGAANLSGDLNFVPFQAHDFSMRGLSSHQSGAKSGSGHLLSFVGTDTLPAIYNLEKYYAANVETELVGTSIPATEHSVMCAYGQDELSSYKRLITEIYPKGFVSIVSDTWDLWGVLRKVITPLKDTIMARDGKVVIRPDSGDPVKILCGDNKSLDENARKGVVEILWEIFGGTVNEKGYKVLDAHIGCIYGDAITLDRCDQICRSLIMKGFASTNVVFGVGSYTYQYVTRDTFGMAYKATWVKISGDEKMIFKDPKTDDGGKKSQKGRVAVTINGDGTIDYVDELDSKYLGPDLMHDIFLNGFTENFQNLKTIRERLVAK